MGKKIHHIFYKYFSGALGGGAELSVACDFRLVTETCQGIGFVHAKMGILPAWGGTNKLVEKVGYAKALDILCSARVMSPSECFKIGLVEDVSKSQLSGSSL